MPRRSGRVPNMTAVAWDALCAAWNHACAYCGRPFDGDAEVEHIEPRSRGGDDSPDNLIPVCCSCNVKKRNLLLLEWVCVQYGLLVRVGPVVTLRGAREDYRPYPEFGLTAPAWAPTMAWIQKTGRRYKQGEYAGVTPRKVA